MTKKKLTTTMVLACGIIFSAQLSATEDQATEDKTCVVVTQTPIIPDGVVASKDEMLAAQDAVKSFQARNLEYLQCLDRKKSTLDAENEEHAEELAALTLAGDKAIQLEESVAAEFNTARKVFLEK
jgi:hypothetical protein